MDVDCTERWKAHERVHELEARNTTNLLAGIERHLAAIDTALSNLQQDRGVFVTRAVYDERHEGLRTDLNRVADSLRADIADLNEARSNLEGRLWALGAIWGVLTILLNVGLHFIIPAAKGG